MAMREDSKDKDGKGWLQLAQARYGALVAIALKAVEAHKAGDTATRDRLNREVETKIAKLDESAQRELKDFTQRLVVVGTVDPGVLYVVGRERFRLTTLVLKSIQRGELKFDAHKFVASVVGLVRQAESRAKNAKADGQFDKATFYMGLAKDLRSAAPKKWFEPRPERADTGTGELEARGLEQYVAEPEPAPVTIGESLSDEERDRIAELQAMAEAELPTRQTPRPRRPRRS